MKEFENFLGAMSKETFFKQYWQKKPLIVKGAFPQAASLANFKQIEEIGISERFETRMVMEEGGEYPWQAFEGPFTKEQLDLKSGKIFTMIAHSLNLYFKNFYQFQKMINFLPTWLFDDVMATYSSKGATVGAHVDNYNVFILQGRGKRLWQIEKNPDTTYIENLDIKLLKNFHPQNEYILEEGDMIYIPPQVAHNGISLEDSLSYSIGFRAFNYKDMIFSYFNHLLEHYENYDYFKMKGNIQKDPNKILKDDFSTIENILKEEILSTERIKEWFGSYTTEPRFIPEEVETPLRKFSTQIIYYKDEHLRLNYFQNKDNFTVNINGENFYLDKEETHQIFEIFSQPPYKKLKFPIKLSKPIEFILIHLYNAGAIFSESDCENIFEPELE